MYIEVTEIDKYITISIPNKCIRDSTLTYFSHLSIDLHVWSHKCMVLYHLALYMYPRRSSFAW